MMQYRGKHMHRNGIAPIASRGTSFSFNLGRIKNGEFVSVSECPIMKAFMLVQLHSVVVRTVNKERHTFTLSWPHNK